MHGALAAGHCYMAYDNYADPTGFIFEAGPAQPAAKPPAAGADGRCPDSSPPRRARTAPFVLIAQAPRTRSLVRLYKDGRLVAAARGGRLEYAVRAPGVYRVEVFLYKHRIGSLCLGAKPWIFSNPIYVQPAVLPAAQPLSAREGREPRRSALADRLLAN